MVFDAPIWLLGLLPWAAVVWWLLPGRGTAAVVPFLRLWGKVPLTSARRGRRWPGVAVLSGLAALLLVILAAGGPSWAGHAVSGSAISIVLDRGRTMALPSVSGNAFRGAIARMPRISDQTVVQMIPVPGQPISTRGDAWREAAAHMTPTGIQVSLDAVVAGQLRTTSGIVFVLSDQLLHVQDPRIVHVVPEAAEPVAGITAMGASLHPHPQVMVRIESPSGAASVPISVRSGNQTLRQVAAFASGQKGVRPLSDRVSGQVRDVFFDLPALGSDVVARINLSGPQHPWSAAYLVRKSNGIQVAVDPTLDDSLRRLADLYGKDRPAAAGATQVFISSQLPATSQPGICVQNIGVSVTTGSWVVQSHAITRDVSAWPAVRSATMPGGFTAVVSANDRVIVAVRDDSKRQIWVNADLSNWEKTADFVVFFANALDWIAEADQSYQSVSPAALGDNWSVVESSNPFTGAVAGEWPGIFRSKDGKQMAVNAGALPDTGAVGTAAADKNVQLITARQSIATQLILAAMGLLVAAALAWKHG